MKASGKLMDMLTGYAASHQHPVNVLVHMNGIPTIMLGVMIPLTWVDISIDTFTFNLAHVLVVVFFLFYMTLDAPFAVVFLVVGFLMEMLASWLGAMPGNTGWIIAAACFFGGYAAQLIEAAGLKGFCLGSACVSDKHANFIISNDNTTAAEVEALIEHIRKTVAEGFGVELETEVRIIGEKS